MENSLAVAQDIKTALLDHGVGNLVCPFTGRTGGVSIELQPGRGTAGRFVAQLNHDTVGPTVTSTRLTPSLYICKNGRSDLQGPLCNGYGGGDFVYRIITLEWANHPGLGGPVTTSSGIIPGNNGRPYLWGTEFEWDGVTAYPDVVLEWQARCNAGITDYFGHQVTDQFEHHDWAPNRKIDRSPGRNGRTSVLRSESIALTRAVWTPTGEDELDVASKEDFQQWMRQVLNEGTGAGQTSWAGTSKAQLKTAQTTVNLINGVSGQVRALAESTADDATKDQLTELAVFIQGQIDELPEEIKAELAAPPTPTT